MSILDHVTLTVSDYACSKAFYEKVLAPLGVVPRMEFDRACGFGCTPKPDGAPGPRPTYHANYHGAFVLDPDGHNIEAVIHTPEP